MIDQILGRPSPTLRRSQILLVLLFWVWRLYKGDGAHPPVGSILDNSSAHGPTRTRSAAPARPSTFGNAWLTDARKRRTWMWRLWVAIAGRSRSTVGWMSRVNERLKHFTPYQLILGTLTIVYALRHLDDLLGIGAPEPLARMYSRSYYRATYINTAFDAGFASAMAIRPKWLKDISSMVFTAYYLVFAREGDEVLRRFRALCTVEMLRVTWEKTNNPYIRLVTYFHRPKVVIVEHVTVPRPSSSSRSHLPPVKAMLFFDGTREQLAQCTQIVIDFPGGGFIAMGPECHEERLRHWAKRTGKPVLGVKYGKAPEYPYPWAIEEGFDLYRTLMETRGRPIGIKSGQLSAVLTGDSAGGNICATIMLRILEHPTGIPRPASMILAYPALDFNYTSWMSPANLRVLRTEQSETHIPGIAHGKNHMRHKSPLSVVDDVGGSKRRTRQKSWGQAIGEKLPHLTRTPASSPVDEKRTAFSPAAWTKSLPRNLSGKIAGWVAGESSDDTSDSENDNDDAETIRGGDAVDWRREADKSLSERVKTPAHERFLDLPRVDSPRPVEDQPVRKKKTPIGTRLTMTSRVGYFQDRVITPSMMRAMAILYVGPKRNPDFETDYYISPILSPSALLAHFPPVYLICGERDPFVDDTVILAGRIREAKRQRRAEAELKQTKSARYGEGLRMSASKSNDAPDHIIRETDEDWVQMRIIEGWGHGFMQMSTLMREVDGVLSEMADWIDESFAKANEVQRDSEELRAAHAAAVSSFKPDEAVLLSPTDHLPPNRSTHVKASTTYKSNTRSEDLGAADLDTPTQDIGGEDGVIAFTPKAKRKLTMPSSRFTPVARRPSKESLSLPRNNSAPRFDVDETGSSGEAFTLRTPPLAARNLPAPEPQKGSKVFAFFNSRGNATAGSSSAPAKPTPVHPSIYSPYGSLPPPARRTSSGSGSGPDKKPNNPLLAAARAASPALAAAGFAPQSVSDVSEAELFRRRRLEAVYGMGESEDHSEEETDGEHD